MKIIPGTSEYFAIHHRLRNKYGKANHCENPNCKKRSSLFEYSLKHDREYSLEIEDYMQLCRCCHRAYDGNGFAGKHHSKKVRDIISKKKIGIPNSEKCKKNITNSLLGRIWITNGTIDRFIYPEQAQELLNKDYNYGRTNYGK